MFRWARRSWVLAVDQSEANHGHASAAGWVGPGRVAGSATAVKFQKVPRAVQVLPYWQTRPDNLSGVSESLIFSQSSFYRRIAATPEGSEESGKRGLHAWHVRDNKAHCFQMGLWAAGGPFWAFCFGASKNMAGPNHVTDPAAVMTM
ncbi:hypothetical protein N8I77_005813 [Diaporthe amygdali]|uniref:Uncharacterized protein n=1 Tax=Phomopsis amygdali TaxID=1214568 RepID=A0AAD9SGS8_PHOAM|nr:hypothetical protein N8I77_005813 [Diaporthe amygdali]